MKRRAQLQRHYPPGAKPTASDGLIARSASKDSGSSAQNEVAIRAISAVAYQGPIPPASEFAKYEQVMPGSAKRIFRMAEKSEAAEIAHIERRDAMIKTSMMIDKVLVCLFLVAAFILAINNKRAEALVSAIVPAAQLMYGVHGKDNTKRDNNSKMGRSK